jgi:ABC-2 type transport system ATP-binding protein
MGRDMIETQDLGKDFDDFVAVDGVSINVQAGELLALLGPNGAGKTTTVRMLTGVLKPSRGWARVAGFDVVQESDKVRASVGVLTENHGFYTRMPAWEYLDFFGQLFGLDLDTRQRRINQLLDDFGLSQFRKRRVGQYSKGMQQKLALARTLLHDPPVLLMDEPTSAMDPESAYLVRDAIRSLRSSKRAIILCTHNLAEAEWLADKIAIIRQGRILIQGEPEVLKKEILGLTEYEVQFSAPIVPKDVRLVGDIPITASGRGWLRFRPQNPEIENPIVLQQLLTSGLPVLSVKEVPHSLEQVYLKVINEPDQAEVINV